MKKCICCKIANGCGEGYQEIAVELEGGWVLNHFGGGETYLGQLVLGTKCHRPDWGDISLKEATTLGINIQRINHSLRQYWIHNYPEDPIELVHVAYLNESPYINGFSGVELLEQLHVHIHLLTRTRKIGKALGYCKDKIGWHLVDKDCVDKFPPEYKVSDINDKKVFCLMHSLEKSLGYNHRKTTKNE